MSDFFLFFVERDTKDFFLEEINLNHQNLKLSFSNKEFISMKAENASIDELVSQLKKNPPLFCKRFGKFTEKVSDKPNHQNFAMVKEDQYWCFDPIPNANDFSSKESFHLPKNAPARAYLKIKEAHHFFDLDFQKNDAVIEIGSAPGGICSYLLVLGLKVTAIDPAKMDENLLSQNKGTIRHLKKNIFDVQKSDLPKECDWVICDLNLPGNVSTDETLRIMEMYPKLKGAFLTIKTPKLSDIARIEKWKAKFSAYKSIQCFRLPSHKREIGVILLNKAQ